MNNQEIVKKDDVIYLSGRVILTIIIGEAINMTELKPHLKCKRIIKEMSKLMAIRKYGGTATEIFEKIMNIKELKKQKEFAFKIYNKFIYPEDIEFLLSNERKK